MDKQCIRCCKVLPATNEYFYRKLHKGKIIGLEDRCKSCEDYQCKQGSTQAMRSKQIFGHKK